MPNSDYVVRRPMVWGNPVKGVILVEGPMDVAALLQWGLDKDYLIVSLLGVGFEAVLSLAVNACTGKPVILALDQDNAGKAAALKHAALLQEQGHVCRVLVDRDRYDAARTCVEVLGKVGQGALSLEQVTELEIANQHVSLVRELRALKAVIGVNWQRAKDHAEMLPWPDGQACFAAGL
jgi:5S rRNA maturation endonuclease (ribonuclease M5)